MTRLPPSSQVLLLGSPDTVASTRQAHKEWTDKTEVDIKAILYIISLPHVLLHLPFIAATATFVLIFVNGRIHKAMTLH